MSITDSAATEEDTVSILSFDNVEEDYALPGRIQHWLSQQCRFGLQEKDLPGLYGIEGPGELLSTMLVKHRDSFSIISEGADEAALRADSPLLGFGLEDERTLVDPLHFPSPTYVRDLPDVCFFFFLFYLLKSNLFLVLSITLFSFSFHINKFFITKKESRLVTTF